MFGGIRLICSEHALKDGDVRLFPESKNRSRRIHKKLVKRFGGEFKKVPAIWMVEDMVIAHPAMFHLIKQELANARVEQRDGHQTEKREPRPSGAFLDRLPLGGLRVGSFMGASYLGSV